MKKIAIFLAGVATFIVAVILLKFWNPIEYGPNIQNSLPFQGCYADELNKLKIDGDILTVKNDQNIVLVKRFLYLKNDAAINTDRNIIFDNSGYIRIGELRTGFFYRFDSAVSPSALLIPDQNGKIRSLRRASC